MTAPPLDCNRFRRAWFFYVGAGIAVFVTGLSAWAGELPCALVCLLLAGYLGAHPWMRNEWYQVGWATGMAGRPRFVCPTCKATSYNPHDIDDGYCGRCHDWTAVP
jgi:ribosomal protein S27AE